MPPFYLSNLILTVAKSQITAILFILIFLFVLPSNRKYCCLKTVMLTCMQGKVICLWKRKLASQKSDKYISHHTTHFIIKMQ